MFPKRVIPVYALLAVAFLINASFTLGQSVTASPSVSQSTGDWPQFRFSPAQIGYNPFEDVLNPSNVPHLKVFWSDIGIGGGFIPSSPVIAKGVVYSANGDGGAVLGGGNNVFAFKVPDGTSLWKGACPGRNNGTGPAVADGVVYVTTGLNSRLCAFEAVTGRPLWDQQLPDIDNYKIWASPTVAAGAVYVGADGGGLYAFKASDGTLLWYQPTGGQIVCSPAVAYDVVYVGGGNTIFGSLAAFKASDGTPLWSQSFGATVGQFSCPAAALNVVYVRSQYGQLFAFKASDGSPLWNQSLSQGPDIWPNFSSPAVADGVVYIGSNDGILYAFKASDGTPLWNHPTGSSALSSSAVANGVVYVGAQDGNLYAFKASDGTPLLNYPTGPSALSSPTVANGTVYVGSAGGNPESSNLYAFTAPTTPPTCTAAVARPAHLWSPHHQLVPIAITGVTDPDGHAVTITVTGVTQDEPVNGKGDGNTSPDAVIQDGAASVRAERSGTGNGRVYHISFRADDGKGDSCTGVVTVSVPHSQKKGMIAIDDGQSYDSTLP
jgi:outer membrane protein assembly factor BamB